MYSIPNDMGRVASELLAAWALLPKHECVPYPLASSPESLFCSGAVMRNGAFVSSARRLTPAGRACRGSPCSSAPAAIAGSGRARSSRAAVRRGSSCRCRSIQASLPNYAAQSKRGRVHADDAGPGARSPGPADRVVQDLLAPGRARCGRSGRAIWCRDRGSRLGSTLALLSLRGP